MEDWRETPHIQYEEKVIASYDGAPKDNRENYITCKSFICRDYSLNLQTHILGILCMCLSCARRWRCGWETFAPFFLSFFNKHIFILGRGDTKLLLNASYILVRFDSSAHCFTETQSLPALNWPIQFALSRVGVHIRTPRQDI